MTPEAKRIRDYAIYILIGLTLGALAILDVKAPARLQVDPQWFGPILMTPVVFWYPIESYRSHWRSWKLWCALTPLLAVHLAAHIAVMRRVDRFPAIWYAFLVPAELVVINAVLWRVVGFPKNPPRKTHKPPASPPDHREERI